jgi:hypothetical protein
VRFEKVENVAFSENVVENSVTVRSDRASMCSCFIDGLVDVMAIKHVSIPVMRLSLGVKLSPRSSQPLVFIDSGGALAPNFEALFQK